MPESPEYSPSLIDTTEKRTRRKWSIDDARRWAEAYSRRVSILKIAKEEGVDPSTVSTWLRKAGVAVKQGQHFVDQPELKVSDSVVGLLQKGPYFVRQLIEQRIYGARVSDDGYIQLVKYSRFVDAYFRKRGVEEIASLLSVHRSTVASWRNGMDVPYLVKLATKAIDPPREGCQWLPMRIDSGGNEQSGWIQVPIDVGGYSDIVDVVGQLKSLESTYKRAQVLGLDGHKVDSMKLELFAYLLGMFVGDASKLGGEGERFNSVNLDLQFSLRRESNEALGEFVCMCMNSLGLSMERAADKQPTGESKLAQVPVGAYRWSSERSPLLAWIRSVCLGLRSGETTSLVPVKMEWLFATPFPFVKRFLQGMADSDGTVKKYVVEITSTPNADLVKRLLLSVGLKSAYVRFENGLPLRTVVKAREAANLPLMNEFTDGYRYRQLMQYKRV